MRDAGKVSYPCPACDYLGARRFGKLPARDGVIIPPYESWLFRCDRCALFFRAPLVDAAKDSDAYARAKSDLWPNTEPRPDFDIVRKCILSRLERGDVLDVGCFTGDFLRQLPRSFRKFGIEPSTDAADKAKTVGVEILGGTSDELKSTGAEFDVITLIDVIEHFARPLDVMETLVGRLRVGGLLIISTGNADSLMWRFLGTRYYYYYNEHVTFYSVAWFSWAAMRLGLRLERSVRFARYRQGVGPTMRDVAKFGLFVAAQLINLIPGAYSASKRLYPLNKAINWRCAPQVRIFPDHIAVVANKVQSC